MKKARLESQWFKEYVKGRWDTVTIKHDYILKG